MEYEVLDIESVKDFLINISQIKGFLEVSSRDQLEVFEIGDGNLNFVFRVTNKKDSSKSLIVKQAVPYLRCIGESFPLSRERMTFEIRALLQYQEITPILIPKIYYSNEQMSVVVMQNLSEHIILRKGLIEKKYYKNLIEDMSTFMAQTLFFTSSLYLDSTAKRELMGKFNSNTELCKLTEDFVFTFPYMEHETNEINEELQSEAQEFFQTNDSFKKNVLELKYRFMTQSDALLHGDLHTGSLMVNEDETYVIDPEFSFIGPFGFDVGAFVANLINAFISHRIVSKDQEYQDWILEVIKGFYSQFEKKFLKLWEEHNDSALLIEGYISEDILELYKKEFMKDIFITSIGFAGCKITRRVFGVAGVEEIRGLQDPIMRKQAELKALEVGQALVLNYKKLDTIEKLIDYLKKI